MREQQCELHSTATDAQRDDKLQLIRQQKQEQHGTETDEQREDRLQQMKEQKHGSSSMLLVSHLLYYVAV